jgi:hypothetical protein
VPEGEGDGGGKVVMNLSGRKRGAARMIEGQLSYVGPRRGCRVGGMLEWHMGKVMRDDVGG